MKKNLLKFYWVVCICIIIALAPIAYINYTLDPLQFYKRAYKYPVKLYQEQRFQNPGLARNYPYNSIILGTSMTENFLPKDIKEKLDLETLKLSISGASAREQYLTGALAIRTRKVKTVLWGLDFSSFRGETDRLQSDSFPRYLYDENIANDFKYILNHETTRLSIETYIRYIKDGKKDEYINADKYSFWFPYATFGEEEMIKKTEEQKKSIQIIEEEYDFSNNIKKSVDDNFIKLVKSNPDIKFIVFFTPASTLRADFFKEKYVFKDELKFREYVAKSCIDFENVELFDFQVANEIVNDYDRYKDMSHYDLETNRYMLECIKNRKYLVIDSENINKEYLEIINKK